MRGRSLRGRWPEDRVRVRGKGCVTGQLPWGWGPWCTWGAGLCGPVGARGWLLSGEGLSAGGPGTPPSVWLLGRLGRVPQAPRGLRAWSPSAFVTQLGGAKCLKVADPLPDGAGGPRGGPRALPGGRQWLRVRTVMPQAFQALAEPGRLRGHRRPLLHGAAVRRLARHGSVAGGAQLRGAPIPAVLRPVLNEAAGGPAWPGAVVLTHGGAEQALDAVGDSDPGVFGGAVQAVVHPRLPGEPWVSRRGRGSHYGRDRGQSYAWRLAGASTSVLFSEARGSRARWQR